MKLFYLLSIITITYSDTEQCYEQPLSSYDIYNQTINDFDHFLGYSNSTIDEPSYYAVEVLARRLIEDDNVTIKNVYNSLPLIIDYRYINKYNRYEKGILTSVKYQGKCGTCVAFAGLGVVESELLKKGIHVDLSEKDIYFCNSDRECNEGWYLHGITQKLLYDGVVAEYYCPYSILTFTCHESCHNEHKFKISDYRYIDDFYSMREWLAYNGTLLTRLNVYSDFYYYKNGIYTKESNNLRGAHAVMVVGYNDIDKYWIAKNSWGDSWGMNGYFHIKYGHAGMMPYSYGYIIDEDVPPTPYTTHATINYVNIFLILIVCHLNLRI